MRLCFWDFVWHGMSVSGVDRILYLHLAQITSIISYSNLPTTPSIPRSPLSTPLSLSLDAKRHAVLLSEVLLLWVPPFCPDFSGLVSVSTWRCLSPASCWQKSTTCSQTPLGTFACTLEAKLRSSVWRILLPCLQRELWKCSHAHLPTLPFFIALSRFPSGVRILPYFIYHNLVLALYSGISCFQMSLQFPCGQQYSWIKCCFLACQDRRLLSPCPPQAVRDRERNGQY